MTRELAFLFKEYVACGKRTGHSPELLSDALRPEVIFAYERGDINSGEENSPKFIRALLDLADSDQPPVDDVASFRLSSV